jgi:putative ABC transport system ATP-binding protein
MIEFRGVGMARGGVTILRDVSFRAGAGEVFCVLGPSGAGKSTVLRLACRLDDPDTGSVLVGGEDARALDVLALRRRVGILFQEPVLFGSTVRENLEFAADPHGRGEALADPGSWLEMVGLPQSLLDRDPGSLSVGQRQRAALARALVPGPEALLLDEPTSALDPQATSGILRLVRDLRDRLGLALVFVTHVVAHAREVADRVVVLKDGAVLEQGEADLLDAPGRDETRAFLEGDEE